MERRIENLERRAQHSVKVCQISNTPNTSGTISLVQSQALQGAELHDGIGLIQQFGFTSVPPMGTNAISLAVTGDQSNKLVIATHNPQLHPKGLKTNELMLYDGLGQSIYLTGQGNLIEITSDAEVTVMIGNQVVLDIRESAVTINGNLMVNGSIMATGDVSAGSISLEGHVHGGVEAGDGDTSGPIG